MSKVSVVGENSTGRNTKFRDEGTGRTMSRASFVSSIEAGNYPDYHVRNVNGIKTPASNPDKSKKNNLG